MSRHTVEDVYRIAQHNEIIHAELTVYEANIGRIPMFDVLVAMVCALDERNQQLQKLAERLMSYGSLPLEDTP